MINTKFEKRTFYQINKLDYIFVSSNISKKYFLKFQKYKLYQNPKLFNTISKTRPFNKFGKKRKRKKKTKDNSSSTRVFLCI